MKTPLTKCACSICVGFRVIVLFSLAAAALLTWGLFALMAGIKEM